MPEIPELNIRHVSPPFRTFCGEKSLSAIPRELSRVGAARAAVICVEPIAENPQAMARLSEAIGDAFVGFFPGVAEHSPLPSVLAARDFLAEVGADAVIAVGGGSAVVTARAAGILLAEDRDIRELCTRRGEDGTLVSPRLSAPKMPQWVVPSTPTSAYAKAGAAVRDPSTGERLALFDPKIRAQGVFLDPGMALTAPPRLAWSSSLNVLSMAVEGLLSRTVDPLADALLGQALRTVSEWVPRLQDDPDDAQPRLHLMLAALMSGQGTDHTGGGLAQALSHAVGPRAGAPNGVVEALLLPHSMRADANAVPYRTAGLAFALGAPAGASMEDLTLEIETLTDRIGVPRRLRDVGMSKDAIDDVAAHAMDDWAITTGPRVPTHDEVVALLAAAW